MLELAQSQCCDCKAEDGEEGELDAQSTVGHYQAHSTKSLWAAFII